MKSESQDNPNTRQEVESQAEEAFGTGQATAPAGQNAVSDWEDRDVVELAFQFLRGTRWPGGALGALGAVLIGVVVGVEEFANRLTSAEYLATLLVGALLALAGPLVVFTRRRELAVPQWTSPLRTMT